ncbi:MAG: GFA family protein [Myxococcota bacterium]
MITGGCLCGAVRFRSSGPTLFASHCHCDTCRRAHAAAFVTWTAVPVGALTVDGEAALRRFRSSPAVERSFCGTCGTPLFYRGDDAPDRVYLPVATVDALDRPVSDHVSYEEHAGWLEGVERLPCHEGKSDRRLPWR